MKVRRELWKKKTCIAHLEVTRQEVCCGFAAKTTAAAAKTTAAAADVAAVAVAAVAQALKVAHD